VILDAISVGSGGRSPHWMLMSIWGVVIYAIVMIAMIHKMFGMILGVADHVLRWISINDSKLSSFSGQAEQKGTQISGAVGAMIQQGGNAAGGAANTLGQANPNVGKTDAPPTDPKAPGGAEGENKQARTLGRFVGNAINKAKGGN
jgi:hypothetical protein